jgi:hypothetical protein
MLPLPLPSDRDAWLRSPMPPRPIHAALRRISFPVRAQFASRAAIRSRTSE